MENTKKQEQTALLEFDVNMNSNKFYMLCLILDKPKTV